MPPAARSTNALIGDAIHGIRDEEESRIIRAIFVDEKEWERMKHRIPHGELFIDDSLDKAGFPNFSIQGVGICRWSDVKPK